MGTMTTNHAADGAAYTLQPDNKYQLRMVVNKAKTAGANGLPLILGGSIDLRDGFTFTTSSPIEATPLQTLSGHSNIVWSVAYNRDGTLASASHDGTIRLWHAESGLELQTLSGHSDMVFSVAYSPDGTTLASASHDPNSSLSNIQLWDVASGSLLKTLSGHTAPIKSVAYSRDGTLASASDDGSIKLWHVAMAKEYPEVQWVTPTPGASNVPTDIYLELGFSQPMDEGSVEASTLRLTDLDNDSHSFEIEIGLAETAGLIDLEWNDDSTILQLTTSHLQPGGGQFTLQPDNDYQLRMVVNKAKTAGANGLPLILGGSIDLRDGFTFTTSSPIEATPLQTLSGHSNIVWSVAYSRDGTLASASHDGTIRLWHAESGLELQTLSGHNGPISSVAYSPDGTTLAFASHDPNSSLSNIQLWEVDSGSLLETLSGHTDPI